MSQALLEIDGSLGEGGGQILRTSLALSLITGRPFHMRHIRAGRKSPGLQPQHLTGVKAAGAIGQAQMRGAALGSTDLLFEPTQVVPGNYRFAIGTAGATSLVLHTVYLPLALKSAEPSELTLEGGTHVLASPCFDFLDVTWRRYLELLGIKITLKLHRLGFYPRGGGVVEAHIQPCPQLRGLHFSERGEGEGEVKKATCISVAVGLPEHVVKRQARRAIYGLEKAGLEVTMREETRPGGPGSFLAVRLETEPVPTLFFGLGARGKPAERVADEAVDQVVEYLRASSAARTGEDGERKNAGTVDAHSADQLVLPLALAEGPSQFTVAEVTSHLLTNVAVIRQALGRDIVYEGEEGEPGLVKIS